MEDVRAAMKTWIEDVRAATKTWMEDVRAAMKIWMENVRAAMKTWMEDVRAAMKTRHLEADQWLTLRRLMFIYMEHPLLMFLDHTQRRSTVGRTPLD